MVLAIFLLGVGCAKKDTNGKDDNGTGTEVENKYQDPIITEIHELKDHRKSHELKGFLEHANPEYRAEAAFALTSVGDTTLAPDLLKAFLNEQNAVVQHNIALAMFQSLNGLSPEMADQLFEKSMNADVKKTVLWVAGRHGIDIHDYLLSKAGTQDDLVKLGLIRAFYELCARKEVHAGFWELTTALMLQTENEQIRIHGAAYLARLTRLADIDLTPVSDRIYDLFRSDNNPLVKMNLATAMALIDDVQRSKRMFRAFDNEQDYRVKVSLLNAMDSSGLGLLMDRLSAILESGNHHVEMAMAHYFYRHAGPEAYESISELLPLVTFWRSKSYLLKAQMRLALEEGDLMASTKENLIDLLEGAAEPFYRAELYGIVGLTDSLAWLEDVIQKEESTVAKTYAVDAYLKALARDSLPNLDFVENELVPPMLKSSDGFLVYTIASNLLHETFTDLKLQRVPKVTIERWELPQSFETRLELEKLHLKLIGEPYEDHFLENPYNNPVNWKYVEQVAEGQKMLIHTDKGDVTIQMCINDAPGSVAYILQLAEDGFYDGLNFHRVVSNFVVQGGDPLGNGTGASPHSLRSEFGWEEYTEGTVGIASAGKDTESCQFFITHNYTPHLNGRYTVIGHVVEGMDVVHQLMVGDVISKVDVL